MLNVSRLVQGSIAALAVGAAVMAVVGTGRPPYATTPANSAPQSTAGSFHLKFAPAKIGKGRTPADQARAVRHAESMAAFDVA